MVPFTVSPIHILGGQNILHLQKRIFHVRFSRCSTDLRESMDESLFFDLTTFLGVALNHALLTFFCQVGNPKKNSSNQKIRTKIWSNMPLKS